MSEVTAEMIERGRGIDPRDVAVRRQNARRIREAREKLSLAGAGCRSFEHELTMLYALRRRGSAVSLALLAILFALVTAQWLSHALVAVWFSLAMGTLLVCRGLAGRVPAFGKAGIGAAQRRIMLAEGLHGASWGLILILACRGADPTDATVLQVAILLVAAINAAVTAAIPGALYCALAPIAVSVVLATWPVGGLRHLLLPILVVGALLCFAGLARKLYESTVQSFVFEAQKDELIVELEQARSNSDLARHRAEESNLAKSRFLATMSHELRTPLNAILGFSEVMKAELFGAHTQPLYRDYANDIHQSGQHLLLLINGILDLSRVEAGRFELREESVDLYALLDECAHLVALRAEKKRIIIDLYPNAGLPNLWADLRAVRQIALNLLSNAIKFTPQGGRVIIALGATPEGGQFFEVCDNGPGIPEAEMPVVMASFGRGSFAQKTAEEGSGLGLPIVKGLVDLHSGSFSLTSKLREGTRARIEFPAIRVLSVMPPLAGDRDPEPSALRNRAA